MDETTTELDATSSPLVADESAADESRADDEALVEGELLVEEVSIDGMCGVY